MKTVCSAFISLKVTIQINCRNSDLSLYAMNRTRQLDRAIYTDSDCGDSFDLNELEKKRLEY